MTQKSVALQEDLQRFVRWAEACHDVRGLVLTGSQAGTAAPDDWSDLDLLVVTRNPQRLLQSVEWLNEIGRPVLVYREPMRAAGQFVIRVVFDDGVEADISPVGARLFGAVVHYLTLSTRAPRVASLIPRRITARLERGGLALLDYSDRGRRFLVDKDSRAQALDAAQRRIGPPPPRVPTADQLVGVVNEFWQQAFRAAKRLARGDLHGAKDAVDVRLKMPLHAMVKWHAGAVHGWDRAPASWTRPDPELWNGDRYFHQWADPRIVAMFRPAFAAYDLADVARALVATTDLFRLAARETADALHVPYPLEGEQFALARVRRACEAVTQPAATTRDREEVSPLPAIPTAQRNDDGLRA